MTRRFKSIKKVPFFWWDFDGYKVIVESDIPAHPVIARFYFGIGDAIPAIEKAEKLIVDLNEGRVTLKQALRK